MFHASYNLWDPRFQEAWLLLMASYMSLTISCSAEASLGPRGLEVALVPMVSADASNQAGLKPCRV